MNIQDASTGTTRRAGGVRWMIGLLAFLGVTALGGGIEMLMYPHGNEFVRAEWLDHLPLFDTWIVPGVVLGLVFGVGSLVTVFGLWRRPAWQALHGMRFDEGRHWAWSSSMFLGIALLAWIALELAVLPDRSWLEAIYAGVGVALVALPLRPSVRADLSL